MLIKKANLLFVDVGFRNTGVAVYSSTLNYFPLVRCITTKRQGDSVAEDCRLSLEIVADELGTIMDRYKPLVVFAELPTGASRSARAIRAMAMAFALMVTFCRVRKVDLVVIKPSEIKRVVLKRGSVSKKECIRAVYKRHGKILDQIKRAQREHVADAILIRDVIRRRLHYV